MKENIGLEVTWRRAIKVWFTFLWMNALAIIASMIIGIIIGTIMVLSLDAIGVSVENMRYVTIPISLIIGMAVSIVPIKMLLSKDFGEFRLVLLQKKQTK